MRLMKSYKFLIPMLFALLLIYASLPTWAQTYTVLHTFTGAPSDGDEPLGTLVRDAGNLYGTTSTGGSGSCTPFAGCGTVFMLNKSGQELGVFSFNGQDGEVPYAGLFRDPAGNLYGTTADGGGSPNCSGCGTIFQLNKTGKKIRYYSFDGIDGQSPESQLVEVSGSLYGTTYLGGTNGWGSIFKINAQGNETVLHSFNITDGCFPYAGLTANAKGNLYGVTFSGGSGGSCNEGGGTAYELDTAGNFTELYQFPGAIGGNAGSALILDSKGNLYGVSETGGLGQDCTGACGSVFELSPINGTWSGRALYSFCSLPGCTDGDRPIGSVVRDASGNIYGTTYFGGAYNNGTIFKLDARGNETVLHSFTGGSDGAYPFGALIIDASGNLYGTAQLGGDTTCDASHGGCGVVFELTP
jgi:uncharacterized repeat protein (TIGR03803 family)